MEGTHNSIMSSAEYLANAQRSFDNIEDGFYISPAFLDKLAIHVRARSAACRPAPLCQPRARTHAHPPACPPSRLPACPQVAKNFLDLPKIKVPLILGIWGGKGQGERARGGRLPLRCWPAWCVTPHAPTPRAPTSHPPRQDLPVQPGVQEAGHLAHRHVGR